MGCNNFYAGYSFDFYPKPNVWHVELRVDFSRTESDEEDNYGMRQYVRSPDFLMIFTFVVQIGSEVNRQIQIMYRSPGYQKDVIEDLFKQAAIGRKAAYNYTMSTFGSKCPIPMNELPVFLSIDHLPENLQDMVKEFVTNNHFKKLTES